MLDRLKQAIVKSYVGAVGLGYLLAQIVLNFVAIFASPIAGWASERVYLNISSAVATQHGIPYEVAFPDFVRFVLLSALFYLLMRWLYFPRRMAAAPETSPQNPQ